MIVMRVEVKDKMGLAVATAAVRETSFKNKDLLFEA